MERRECTVGYPLTLTDETKDVPDGGDEDDQGVGSAQQGQCDDAVTNPAELLGRTQELIDGGANLQTKKKKGS